MKSTQLALAAVFFIAFGITACDEGNDPTSNVPPTRTVTVNITGTGAEGVTHNAPAAILQSTTQLAVALSDVPANATVTATNGAVAGNEVTFAFAVGASPLSFAITVTAATVDTPTVTLTPTSVTINDSNLTASVNVTGTATGVISLNTAALPAGVTASVSGTTISVIGVRQSIAVNDTFVVGVTRQGVTQNLSVAVNLTADVTAPTVILSSNSVTINDGNLTASVNVTGTATGAVTLNTATLPTGVTATVSGTAITVTGVRQASAINDTFSVGVTRQGITQNLSVAVNLTADVTAPTVILTPDSVTIDDGNLTASVNVTGTATGVISLDTATLPTGVTATVSGTTITVIGVRQATAINDTFSVGVTRQGVTQNLLVAVNLTADVTAPTLILTPNSVTIDDGNLTASVNVTGTATGAVSLNTANLPAEVTASVSGTTITVTGVRQATAVNGNFTVGVTRQGITQNLSVVVNLTAVDVPDPFAGFWPGLYHLSPEALLSAGAATLPIAGIPANNISMVMNRVNLNSVAADGAYTLLLNDNASVTAQHIITADRQLTIIGIGGERTIQFNGPGNQMLFNVNGNNATSLTLGNNITLRGGISTSSVNVIGVSNGNLIMLDGSKITGHTTSSATGAVLVSGNGNFTMEGGEIIGNISTGTNVNGNGGVRVQGGGNFTMNGGRIYGNFRNTNIPADVTVNANAGSSNTGGIPIGTPEAPITVNHGQPGIGVLLDLLTSTVTLTPSSVTINDGTLTASVTVTGTATGAISLNTATLPTGVTATVSGTTITVTGVRQSTAVSGNFTVGVTRQGVTQNLSVAVNLTAAPPVMLTPDSVTINDGTLTASVNVTGTATGAVTLNTSTLPTGVSATVSGTTITVTGVRQQTAVSGTFTVGVTRQGVTQNLSVVVNLSEATGFDLFAPGLFLGAPETLTSASTPIAGINANDLVAAITRVNLAGSENDGAYTLLISENVTVTTLQTLTIPNRQLTIIGIGGERTIGRTTASELFAVGALTAQPAISLTIGNNITLIGRTNGEHGATSDNNAGVVFVRNGGSFVMLDGSKITGNTNNVPGVAGNAGAALTVNTGASFNMQGGTITGNAAVNATADHVGGVVVRGVNSSFTMSGGTITGNTVGGRQGTPRDVLIHNDNGVTFTQTGGTIGVLDNRLP